MRFWVLVVAAVVRMKTRLIAPSTIVPMVIDTSSSMSEKPVVLADEAGGAGHQQVPPAVPLMLRSTV